jgi:hypothetical protein
VALADDLVLPRKVKRMSLGVGCGFGGLFIFTVLKVTVRQISIVFCIFFLVDLFVEVL